MQYVLVMKDSRNMLGENVFYADNDGIALSIAENIAIQSRCGVVRLLKVGFVPIDVSQPDVLSTIFAKGVCYYETEVSGGKVHTRLAVYDPRFVSDVLPVIEIEPFIPTLVGRLENKHGSLVTTFKSAKYMLIQNY